MCKLKEGSSAGWPENFQLRRARSLTSFRLLRGRSREEWWQAWLGLLLAELLVTVAPLVWLLGFWRHIIRIPRSCRRWVYSWVPRPGERLQWVIGPSSRHFIREINLNAMIPTRNLIMMSDAQSTMTLMRTERPSLSTKTIRQLLNLLPWLKWPTTKLNKKKRLTKSTTRSIWRRKAAAGLSNAPLI